MSDECVVTSSVGHITFRSRTFFILDSMNVTSLVSPFSSQPTRYPAIASIGAMVADRPILVKSVVQYSLRRSIVNDRNAPLFESQISWISSKITHSIFWKLSLNFGASRINANDSGVVMRMCGGCFTIFCLSYCDVSPDLTATRMLGMFIP